MGEIMYGMVKIAFGSNFRNSIFVTFTRFKVPESKNQNFNDW